MVELDASQQSFCDAPAGNIRLLAPAGCGKTHSLLHRCLSLQKRDRERRLRYLILTFTVAARDELRSRMHEQAIFSSIRDQVEIATLNSWGYRRIKSQAFSPKLITSKKDFHFTMKNQLQPVWMKHKAVKAAIEAKPNAIPMKLFQMIDWFKALGFEHVKHRKFENFVEHVEAIRGIGLGWRLDELMDELVSLDVLSDKRTGKTEDNPVTDRKLYDKFFRFWCDAAAHLISSATFTLEDQKYFAYIDERQKADEKKPLRGAARYDHVLVDEFQDVNPLDLNLTKAIADRSRAILTVVGDDDQAIFEWRGATPEYILHPEVYFNRSFNTHTLAVNYRSPANIVRVSQVLICQNKRRVNKQTQSNRSDDAVIETCVSQSVSEALDDIHRVVDEEFQTHGKRVALIGRKRAQLIPYQIYFASRDVPFCAAEDLQIFMSHAFERLIELIEIQADCQNRSRSTRISDQLLTLCNLVKRYPLSKNDRTPLQRHLHQNASKTLVDSIDAVESYRGPLKGQNVDGLMSTDFADAIRAFLQSESVSEALESLSTNFTGLQVDLGKAEDDIFYLDPPFAQLAEFAATYADDYDRFLEDVQRAKDQLISVRPFEEDVGTDQSVWNRPLHLMTALRAKGKEFDSVVLLDLVDGIWPNRNAKTPRQLEAERRVFYVAFTRVRTRLILHRPRRVGTKTAVPSPFLDELGLTE